MISRVTAEFESPEMAEYAMKRVRESIQYVYSAKMIEEKKQAISRKTAFSVIPAYYNSHTNMLTSVLDSPVSDEAFHDHIIKRKAYSCIICGSAAVDNVIALLNSLGGTNIRFAQ